MSAHSGLAFEVHAFQREVRSFDVGAGGESDAVLALVRAARRLSRLAQELAIAPHGAGAARDKVSLARVTDACLAGESGRIDPDDLHAAIALIARRATAAEPGVPVEMDRVQRTLSAIANLPGVSAE
jgi:hypothetical protein